MEAVKFVMYEKLLFWMEVMSVLGRAYEVSGILTQVLAWPGLKVCLQIVYCNTCLMVGGQTLDPDNELTSFIRDALRFISAFIVPISESAPHIYLSTLPFSPERSLVADKFCSRFPNTLKVIEGRPVQWPMTIFTAEHHNDSVECIVFSPDGKTFASISRRAIYICNFETGYCISGPFELEDIYHNVEGEVDEVDACFSPDGKHVLVHCMHHAVVWDIERGKKQFETESHDSVFTCHGHYHGRIASTHRDRTGVQVKLWDAGNGVLMSDKLFEVTGASITRFSPDGRLLAIGKRSGNVIELWNVEDGKDVQIFPYPSGNLSSLRFSPTSNFLVAAFRSPDRIYLWRLDTQETPSISIEIGRAPPAFLHLLSTDHLFISRYRTLEIWEVSMTGFKIISESESPMALRISCICPSRDGRRLLVGSEDGSVMMWNLNAEDSADVRPLTANIQDDTDMLRVISFSHSGKIVATISQSSHVEFRDTTTWEIVGYTNIEYEYDMKIVFSRDDNQVAFLFDSVITVHTMCDVMLLKDNVISLKPWQFTGQVAFQICDDLVICAELDNSDGLLQVWRLTGLQCASSLDIKIPKYSRIFLAPDGLTVAIANRDTASCYSRNHDTAQFDPSHFTDEAHLVGYGHVYSPDGVFFACQSQKDSNTRVWDTRTGQLCGRPMPMPGRVDTMALSPALKDQFLGDRIIAVRCSNTISVFDVHTGRLYAQLYVPAITIYYPSMSFIQDGTKLALHSFRTMGIWDVRAEYLHATHGYALILQGMKDGWMMDQVNAPLFWVPSEHRKSLCIPLPKIVIGVPRGNATSLDLSSSRLGNEWMECIDKRWLKALEEKGSKRKLLE